VTCSVDEKHIQILARDLLVHHADEPVIAYRIVKGIHRGHPDMLDSFRSNYELGAPPRGLEFESTLIHLGLSMYLKLQYGDRDSAALAADRRRIAEVHLEPNNGSATHIPLSQATSQSGDGRCSCWRA